MKRGERTNKRKKKKGGVRERFISIHWILFFMRIPRSLSLSLSRSLSPCRFHPDIGHFLVLYLFASPASRFCSDF